MENTKKTTGLSRDFIIHPGESLSEILEDRNMSQKELSVRTGVTEKHISTVIHGQKNISAAFARKLEYALGIEASFWMNLQTSYDQKILEFDELNNISNDEMSLLSTLEEVLDDWSQQGWIDLTSSKVAQVLDLRRICEISNLLDIPRTRYVTAYRTQTSHVRTDPYILFAWQRMCELRTKNMETSEEVDIDLLKSRIPEIKQTMFLTQEQIQKNLTQIFAECGICFCIVPHYEGAPVQGFVKKVANEQLILCITIRNKYADIFWFTLFHEIAHILNGDTTKEVFLDFDSVAGNIEQRANKTASELLIRAEAYRAFIESKRYESPQEIKAFAESQCVTDFIVQGRLMNDHLISWEDRQRYS